MTPYTVKDATYEREVVVQAFSAERAAEDGVDMMERQNAEFQCAGGETIRVTVTDDAGRVSEYDVTGRMEAVYQSRKVK